MWINIRNVSSNYNDYWNFSGNGMRVFAHQKFSIFIENICKYPVDTIHHDIVAILQCISYNCCHFKESGYISYTCVFLSFFEKKKSQKRARIIGNALCASTSEKAQTVFACVHMHAVDKIPDKYLRYLTLGVLKLSGLANKAIQDAQVFDDDEFQPYRDGFCKILLRYRKLLCIDFIVKNWQKFWIFHGPGEISYNCYKSFKGN